VRFTAEEENDVLASLALESSHFSRRTGKTIPLQSSADVEGTDDGASTPKNRFDWRQRAVSRIRKKPESSVARKVFRRKPALTQVQPGEPYYDAIQSYSKK
jgi:hypothetical protein